MLRRSRKSSARGFSLLEVVIALAILGMSLAVLLQSQASSINNAGRSRDLSIAALLARSKMIDIEVELHDEGFTLGDQEANGDFGDEGHEEIKWTSTVKEIEIDLSNYITEDWVVDERAMKPGSSFAKYSHPLSELKISCGFGSGC